MEKANIDDSLTATMSYGSDGDDSLPKRHRTSRPSKIFKRRTKMPRQSSSVNINDLPEEERLKAVKFDLDGSGTLDRIELAMMRYDANGDGELGLDEIHDIVEEHLRDKSSLGAMRKIIVGLTCFVFILSLSNLGTSLASAILVKETTADTNTSEMKLKNTADVIGTQSSTETFQALEMDVDMRRARRAMVVESLKANPFGEHAHRRLGKGCQGKKCDKDIAFDTNYMSQDDAEKIKEKCKNGRNVNILRMFPGGSADTSSLCKTGASIIVKEKKTKSKRNKGNGKGKKRISFDMVVTSDGKDTVFDCDGKNCFMSGTNLLQKHGEPCNINHGSDDCSSGLVCIPNSDDAASGKCLADWEKAVWYVDWDNHKCVQDCTGGSPNCGGNANYWDEKFADYTLCCDTQLSYLPSHRQCVPDFDFLKKQN